MTKFSEKQVVNIVHDYLSHNEIIYSQECIEKLSDFIEEAAATKIYVEVSDDLTDVEKSERILRLRVTVDAP